MDLQNMPPRPAYHPNILNGQHHAGFDVDAYMRSDAKSPIMASPISSTATTYSSLPNRPEPVGEDAVSPTYQDPHSTDSKARLQASSTEPRPAWAEMKTKAGKDRKRLPLACIACRRKKIRCSGEKPACKHCLKARTPCVYKVTARKPAPRTDYMAMLDKRLKRMEDRVIKIIPKDDMQDVPPVQRAVVKPTQDPNSKSSKTRKRSAVEAFGNDVENWADDKARNNDSPRSLDAKTPHSEENTLLSEGADKLPSREIQEHLVEVYFDYLYGQSYHVLHKPSFMRRFEAGTVPPVLLLAVCAVSARFAKHPQVNTDPAFLRGGVWSKHAQEIALKRFDSPNLTVLIVFLLLGLHHFGTCQGGASWMFGGMAHRMAYALQLHKDLSHDPMNKPDNSNPELSFTDREIRRRTMWACFIMDRFNSSGTHRPMFASEEYMDLQLPIKEMNFIQEVPGTTETLEARSSESGSSKKSSSGDAVQNMDVSAYIVRIIALWGRLVQYLNLGGREKDPYPAWSPKSKHTALRKEVDEFNSTLPESLKYTSENLQIHDADRSANQFLYLHVLYYQCVLFIHRFAFPTTARVKVSRDMPVQFLQDSKKKGIEAAGTISRLLETGMNHRLIAPFSGYCAYLSSAVHIHGAFSREPKLEASSKENLARNVKYLSKMKRYWGNLYFLTESLKELYRHYADSAPRGTTTPTPKPPKLAHQYGDWYDRYPNGVSGTDFDEGTDVKKEEGDDAVLSQEADLQSFDQFFDTLSPSSKRKQPNNTNRKSATTNSKLEKAQRLMPQQNSMYPQDTPNGMNPNLEMSNGAMTFPESYDRSPINPQQMPNQVPGGLQGQMVDPSLAFEPTQPASAMSYLDRQMVLASYDGTDPFGASQDAINNFWNAGLSPTGEEVLNDAQNTWFMPFNLNPPDFIHNNEFMPPGQANPGQPDMWFHPAAQDPSLDSNMGVRRG